MRKFEIGRLTECYIYIYIMVRELLMGVQDVAFLSL